MLQTSAVINVTQGMEDLYVVTSHVNSKTTYTRVMWLWVAIILVNLSKKALEPDRELGTKGLL